jgi:asparagine synthase (glutamine-hydrolysing)
MCGIAGVVDFDRGGAVNSESLQRMADALAHRGPDGGGFHVAGTVGFAHRRLAIIDPQGGQQPLVDPDSGLAITYNGEVYNYIEIRNELGEADFKTDCDTEVVLRAWRRWGPAALDRFRGMFAFAIHDPRQNKVYLVRDRVGIKPLYYKVSDSGVIFASELCALAAVDPDLEVAPDALSLYFRFGYVPTPKSIYRNIFKLEPGHYVTLDLSRGKIIKTPYWRLNALGRRIDERAALAELDELLRQTIKIYVRSDVPFGSFLSGGIDSSLVTALMGEELSDAVRTFSIGFSDPRYSELPYAKEAARTIGTSHRSEVMSANFSLELIERAVSRFAEPFADSSCLPTWYVSHLAAQDVKMVLSGDGGDELFAGYNSYPDVFDQAKRENTSRFYRAAAHLAPVGRIRRYAQSRSLSWQDMHHRQRDTFPPAEREQLTGTAPTPFGDEAITEFKSLDPVTRCQKRDVETYLLDDILVKVDRMSMDNSLEVRVPLLDHKLIEFAFSLPLELKIRRNGDHIERKFLLKRAAEKFFPPAFINRPKAGFGIPLHPWLEGPMRPMVEDLLDTGAPNLAPLLDPQAVRRMVREFYGGQAERVGQIWALLCFCMWQQRVRSVNVVTPQRTDAQEMSVGL